MTEAIEYKLANPKESEMNQKEIEEARAKGVQIVYIPKKHKLSNGMQGIKTSDGVEYELVGRGSKTIKSVIPRVRRSKKARRKMRQEAFAAEAATK